MSATQATTASGPASITFGAYDVASEVRDEHADHLDPSDDARTKTVTFDSDAPDRILELAERAASESRAERESGAGQVALTSAERDRIDFSEGRASIPHARSVKAIMLNEGVDDWTAFYDPTLTVDEHREVAEQAAQDVRGERLDAEESATQKEARAAARASAEECDHAEGFCKMGDPDACEFLREHCDVTEAEIDEITDDSTELGGAALGALRRSWGGYQGAIRQAEDATDPAERTAHLDHARQASRAINAIRREHDQEPLTFDRLAAVESEPIESEPIEPPTTDEPDEPDVSPESDGSGRWAAVVAVILLVLFGLASVVTGSGDGSNFEAGGQIR